MRLEYVTGNLFDAPQKVLAHGCNAKGVMGRGIAVGFRERWPAMYQMYKEMCEKGDLRPGDLFAYPLIGRTEEDKTIFNLITQDDWRPPGPNATLDFIEGAVENAVWRLTNVLYLRAFAMPKIGAGLGGLEWADVAERLESIETDVSAIIYTLPEARVA